MTAARGARRSSFARDVRRDAGARRRSLASALLLAAGLALVRPVAAAPAVSRADTVSATAGRCGVCHPAERVQHEKSRHALEGVRCVSCHGGDDRSLQQGAAHGAGFRGRPARREIPALCASCHSDEQKMRAYNLPVDQFALYQTSAHGLRLAKGDTRVAVCSDCHGAHEILAPEDPASSLYVLNIPRTCGTCHGDKALLQERGLSDAYAAYQSSVHAKALFEKSNRNAPTCVSCHGVHGAAPPNVGDVDKVCGQCHTAERRYYTAGAHSQRLGGTRPECVNCHENHAVEAAKPERWAGACTSCHEGQAATVALGRRIWDDYRSAASEVDRAEAILARADAIPMQTEDYHARIEEARTYLREALPAAHAVREDLVAGFTTRAAGVGREVQEEIQKKFSNRTQAKFLLVLFWFYVLLTLFVLRRFRDQAGRRA